MHFGISRLVRILCGTRRTDDGGIHDGAAAYLQSAPLQYLADLGEQLLAELVALQQPPELQERRTIRNALAPQVNADESPQCGAIQQRFLAGFIGQVEPVPHKVHAQHALQTHWRATALTLRIVRLDNLAQLRPRHDLLHRLKEHIAFGWPTVLFKSGALIGRHRKGLLFHAYLTIERPMPLTFFSVALLRQTPSGAGF